ncbi:MAG: hypothetical protein U0Y82_03385 [Thermoleophilia bacterium]
MSASTAQVRLIAALGAVEMALVRRDAVAGPLLAQARRAAEGHPAIDTLHIAHDIARTVDLTQRTDAADAARKVCQALTRAAVQMVQADARGEA